MSITMHGVEYYNQKFVDTAENFDPFLQQRVRSHPTVWIDRIMRGQLSLFDGLVRKTNIFHGGMGEQSSLTNWSPIQVSRKASDGSPAYDACNYDPKTIDYSFEARQFFPYQCSWQSEPVCVKDFRWVEEARMQCEYQTAAMAYHTQSVWENWNREQYVQFALNAGHGFLLCEGGIDYENSTNRFAYNPFVVDSDGDTYITFPDDTQISTINMSYFDFLQDHLGIQCPEAAPANRDGMPIFGMMIHSRDFKNYVFGDAAVREDYRYARSSILLEGYKKYTEYQDWAIMHDPRQMRFKIKKVSGGNIVAKRVEPMRAGNPGTIGYIPEANPDYTTAEFAVGVVFMNQIFSDMIPAPLGDAGGMQFGTVPSMMGEFSWLNIKDKLTNPLGEVGNFFARFEVAAKPLEYAGEAIVFLYRRCPQQFVTDCDTCCGGEEGTGAIAVAASAASGDEDRTNYTLTLTLASCLPCEAPEKVTLTNASSATVTGYIADSSVAPQYTFVCETDPGAYTDWTTDATVTCA